MKLADFGVAARLSEGPDTNELSLSVVGTPYWMAPEVRAPVSGSTEEPTVGPELAQRYPRMFCGWSVSSLTCKTSRVVLLASCRRLLCEPLTWFRAELCLWWAGHRDERRFSGVRHLERRLPGHGAAHRGTTLQRAAAYERPLPSRSGAPCFLTSRPCAPQILFKGHCPVFVITRLSAGLS